MAERILPGLGLTGFWDLGADGYKDAMDIDWRLLSALTQAGALDLVSAEPGTPSDGDIYLLDETHATQPNDIAVRDAGAWVYITPAEGWIVYDATAGYHRKFDGSVWAQLISGGGGPAAVSTQAGTTYTAVIGDANTYIQFTNASAVAFTIPAEASVNFPVGTVIALEQVGAGTVTLTPDAGVTINSRGSVLGTAGQYAVAQVKKVGSDTWTAIGDLA